MSQVEPVAAFIGILLIVSFYVKFNTKQIQSIANNQAHAGTPILSCKALVPLLTV